MRNKAATENTLNRFRRRPLIQDAVFVMQNIASGKRLLFQLAGLSTAAKKCTSAAAQKCTTGSVLAWSYCQKLTGR